MSRKQRDRRNVRDFTLRPVCDKSENMKENLAGDVESANFKWFAQYSSFNVPVVF